MDTVGKRTYNKSQKMMDNSFPIRPTRPPKGNGTTVIQYSGGSIMVRPFVVHELLRSGVIEATEDLRTFIAKDDDNLWAGLRGDD